MRIERVYEPVPVAPGEKREAEARATRNMRRTQPNWRWNGPPIPDAKPPIEDVHVSRDGRIWVQLSQPGIQVDDPDYDPTDPESIENRWRAPIAFDVFEADGTYLGRVPTDMEFNMYPTPIFGAEYVWATTQDDFGVQRVVRYQIHVPAQETD